MSQKRFAKLGIFAVASLVVTSAATCTSSIPIYPPATNDGGGGAGGTGTTTTTTGSTTTPPPPSCSDKVKNQDETDVDCGGSCTKCGNGKSCAADADCASDQCDPAGSFCVAPGCDDEMKNGDETDVDCGGACAPCMNGKVCAIDSDCGSGYCNLASKVCAAPSCFDSVKNGGESDVDCSGPCSAKCADGATCTTSADCTSKVCSGGTCVPPGCADGVKNGTESDVDCGGSGGCPRCPLTKQCQTASDCVSLTCTGGACVCPTGTVTSPKLGGGTFCIDQKEVTYKQYSVFYTANPSTSTQPAECSWNTSYTPSGNWPAQPGHDDEPVRYVNWCQAEAYCRYNNRHLCGSFQGGATPQGSFTDAAVSEWYSACSGQGANQYPYGNTFQPDSCVSALKAMDGGVTSPATAGANPLCQGGTPTLLDMSGNVAEWESSCDLSTGQSDQCLVRGGSFESSTPESLRCDSGGAPALKSRSYTGPDVGFRCCL
jgi:hypothetical protein